MPRKSTIIRQHCVQPAGFISLFPEVKKKGIRSDLGTLPLTASKISWALKIRDKESKFFPECVRCGT